jgi:hypothetical protein
MENSLYIPEPVALARPRGAHRFEAFSPKLARRVMFYRRPLLGQWLLLETNPKAIAFCERPGYVMINGSRRLADFWVHYVDLRELVILIESEIDGSVTAFPCDGIVKLPRVRRHDGRCDDYQKAVDGFWASWANSRHATNRAASCLR